MAVQIIQDPYAEAEYKRQQELGAQMGRGMLRRMGLAPEQQFLEGLGDLDLNDPSSMFKISQRFLEMGDYDRAISAFQQGRLLQEQLAPKTSKVSAPGSPLTRELRSAAELIQMDPDLTSAGLSKIGLTDKELKAAAKEVASRAKQLQKQYASEGTSLAYVEAEQLALDLMKQEGKFTPKEHLFGLVSSVDYEPQPVVMQPGEQREVVKRRTKDGKIGLFDANTKEFIGYE